MRNPVAIDRSLFSGGPGGFLCFDSVWCDVVCRLKFRWLTACVSLGGPVSVGEMSW